jgi:hypothetical protein
MAYKINPYNKFDKPYKNIKTIPKNTISDLFNLIEQMDTQEIMQYSLKYGLRNSIFIYK